MDSALFPIAVVAISAAWALALLVQLARDLAPHALRRLQDWPRFEPVAIWTLTAICFALMLVGIAHR